MFIAVVQVANPSQSTHYVETGIGVIAKTEFEMEQYQPFHSVLFQILLSENIPYPSLKPKNFDLEIKTFLLITGNYRVFHSVSFHSISGLVTTGIEVTRTCIIKETPSLKN